MQICNLIYLKRTDLKSPADPSMNVCERTRIVRDYQVETIRLGMWIIIGDESESEKTRSIEACKMRGLRSAISCWITMDMPLLQ